MAARHVGRRIGTVSSQHRAAERRRRSTPAAPHRVQRGKRETLTPGERRHLIQLVACGSIFVLLVAVKLLLPGRMAQVNAKLTGMLEQNIDVQAVFSAVGRAVSGEADVDVALQDMYQAVFDPQEDSAVEVSAPAGGEAVSLQLPAAIAPLRAFRTGTGSSDGWLDLPAAAAQTAETAQTAEADQTAETAETASQGAAEASTLAYVLYSDQNLPDNVCLEQALLGFDYCTPVMGTLTSDFGYREHPVEGEERFHYGLDIGAATDAAPIGSDATSVYNHIFVYVSDEVYDRTIAGWDSAGPRRLYFTAKGDASKLSEEIRKTLAGNGILQYSLTDIAEMTAINRNMLLVVNVFSYGFIVLISLITTANVLNTISTNINLRRREFAMLKSVGITPGGFNRMMNFECVFYGLKALLYGLPLSLLATYLIYLSMSQGLGMAFTLPWTAILIASASVFLVVFVTMMYSMSKIKKENIVDALKNENL